MRRHRPPVFSSLPLVSVVSLVIQVMMVVASSLNLHTLMKTFVAILTHTCVVPLLKVEPRSSSLGMKILC